jgi:formylmethanofuran dehydrogenase subunit E
VNEETNLLEASIKDAVKLHGHLGPFLVIGVRMGMAAKRLLEPQDHHHADLKVSVELHLHTPFSCILDGIQVMTRSTIGNQRLRVKESRRKITARFETADSGKRLTIAVSPELVKDVMDRMSKGGTNEVIASLIASTPEDRLFQCSLVETKGAKTR